MQNNKKDIVKPLEEYLSDEVFREDKGLSKDEYKATRPKIAVALSKNITLSKGNIITRSGVEFKQEGEPILLRREREYGLGKKDIQLIFALNIYMARWGKDSQIQEYIRMISEEGREPGIKIARWIDITDLTSLLLYGEYGKATRERERVETYSKLKKLSEIRQHFTYKGPLYYEDDGTIPDQKIEIEDNILGNVGKTFSYPAPRTGEIHIFSEVVFSSIFFQNLSKQFTPIDPSILVIRDESGKIINNSELFWSIASLLHAERYRFISIGVAEAKRKADEKYKNVKSYTERRALINKAIDNALIFKVSIKKILEITPADYSNRKRMNKKGKKGDFWKDLEKALKALKLYGIITERSYIDMEKDIVVFFFERKFATTPEFHIPEPEKEDGNLLLENIKPKK